MFQFLQPILLFSAAGIAIPVFIHLWNIKPGKTLKIGSISLLTKGSRQRAKSLKLVDLLLLFLRCILLIVLALLISKPVWKQQVSAGKQKGWILLEKESLHKGYKNYTSAIDSLLKAGYEFHYFNSGFEKDNLQKALKIQKDTVSVNQIPYWSLLAKLNEKIPGSVPVYLFTDNSLNRFAGTRPQLSLNLHWQTYSSADSIAVWPEKAFITSPDSVHLSIGHSKPAGTFYTHKNFPLADMSDADYNIGVNNGKLTIGLKRNETEENKTNNSNINIDTSAIKITVFTDKFNTGTNYV